MQITGDFVFVMGLWGVIGAVLSVVFAYSYFGNSIMAAGDMSLGGASGRRRRVRRSHAEPNIDEIKYSLVKLGDKLRGLSDTRISEGAAGVAGNIVALYGIKNAAVLIDEAGRPGYFGESKIKYNLERALEDLSLVNKYKPTDESLLKNAEDASAYVNKVLKELKNYKKARPAML